MSDSDRPPSLAGAPWLKASETQAVMAAIEAGGHEVRAVGGAIRNALMGLPVMDIDLATTARPEAVVGCVTVAGLRAVPTGITHGTITVIAGHTPFEVTTLRKDVETHGRHATVEYTDDWAADAARRDFTVNALYCDAAGTVSDPLGGYRDIPARRIRFIGDPRERIREDYLRILRFFRFSADYAQGPLDAAGLAASVSERDGLAKLSGERVRQELVRLLVAPRVEAAVDAMIGFGLLSSLLGAAPRPAVFARLIAIESHYGLAPAAMLRLGALAVEVAEDAERLAQRLRLSGDEREMLALACRPPFDVSPPAPSVQRERLYRLGERAYRATAALDLARAIGVDVGDLDWAAALSLADRWKPQPLPVRGADVIAEGIPAGPAVGEVLRDVEAWWIGTDFAATIDGCRAKLAEVAARHLSQMGR
jgi:poly(A) polymerase